MNSHPIDSWVYSSEKVAADAQRKYQPVRAPTSVSPLYILRADAVIFANLLTL